MRSGGKSCPLRLQDLGASLGSGQPSALLMSSFVTADRSHGQNAWTKRGKQATRPRHLLCNSLIRLDHSPHAGVAELADARDLKSRVPQGACGFDPRPRHQLAKKFALRDSSAIPADLSVTNVYICRGKKARLLLVRLGRRVPGEQPASRHASSLPDV